MILLLPFGVNVNVPSLAVAAVTFDLKVAVPSLSIEVTNTEELNVAVPSISIVLEPPQHSSELIDPSKIAIPSISYKFIPTVLPIVPVKVFVDPVTCIVPSLAALLPLMLPEIVASLFVANIAFVSPAGVSQ